MISMKNANLNSKESALVNMLNGTRYFWNNIEMYWDKNLSLFMCIGVNKTPYQLVNHLRHYKEFKVKCEWFRNIPAKGILCWCRRPGQPYYVVKIWEFDGIFVKDINGMDYPVQYLTPLTIEELNEFIENIS